jgi:hypothetical protein
MAFALFLCAPALHGQVLLSLLFGESLNTGKVEFGLDGGINVASLHGIDEAQGHLIWNLGFYFDIKLSDPAWMFHTGVIVKSTLGAEHVPVYRLNDALLDSSFKGGSVTTTLNYFDVPVMLKYKFENDFYLEGGAMFGLMYGATDEFVNSVKEDDDLRYDRSVRDAYHPLDAGIIVGAGYRLFGKDGINIGVRYYYGLVDIYIDDTTPGQFNRSLYLTVGIPIGAAKDAEGQK